MSVRIVLADDHKVMRDGLRAILERDGDFQVIGEASDGRQAVSVACDLEPDVIIMDINMPLLNGIEATRKIKEQCPDVQVVILSMHTTKEHIFQAMKSGARGYLLKETSGSEVVQAIRAVQQGNRYLSQVITEKVIDDYIVQRSKVSDASPLSALSDREREVLQLVVEGRTTSEVSALLHLSTSTVSTYRSRIMAKLEVKDFPQLVRFALQNNLIDNTRTDSPNQ